MSKLKFEAVSIVSVADKDKNLEKYQKYIDDAGARGVDVLVLPEISSTGLPEGLSMFGYSEDGHKYFEDVAELVPGGRTVTMVEELAAKYGMYICWSMIEADPYYPECRYNTAVLVGPDGFIGKYHKVHPAGTEKLMYNKGEATSEVFDTPIGKIGMLICFDKTFPYMVREMKLKGAEIILCPTAWPGTDRNMDQYDLSMQLHRYAGRARTMENGVFWIDANLAAPEEEFKGAEGGHARIMNPCGEILAETGWTEASICVEADPQAEIAAYYAKLGMSEAEHIAALQKQQDLYEKCRMTAKVVITNILFYGDAVCNTIADLPIACYYKYKLK